MNKKQEEQLHLRCTKELFNTLQKEHQHFCDKMNLNISFNKYCLMLLKTALEIK